MPSTIWWAFLYVIVRYIGLLEGNFLSTIRCLGWGGPRETLILTSGGLRVGFVLKVSTHYETAQHYRGHDNVAKIVHWLQHIVLDDRHLISNTCLSFGPACSSVFLSVFCDGELCSLTSTGIILGILQRQCIHRHARQPPLRTACKTLTRDRVCWFPVGWCRRFNGTYCMLRACGEVGFVELP